MLTVEAGDWITCVARVPQWWGRYLRPPVIGEKYIFAREANGGYKSRDSEDSYCVATASSTLDDDPIIVPACVFRLPYKDNYHEGDIGMYELIDLEEIWKPYERQIVIESAIMKAQSSGLVATVKTIHSKLLAVEGRFPKDVKRDKRWESGIEVRISWDC